MGNTAEKTEHRLKTVDSTAEQEQNNPVFIFSIQLLESYVRDSICNLTKKLIAISMSLLPRVLSRSI